jgi:hypothetical protein
LTPASPDRLLQSSPGTIERLLSLVRLVTGGERVSVRRCDVLPVRSFVDWNDPPHGFVEVDFVATLELGSFVQTLVLTDIATGWTEWRAGHFPQKSAAHCALRSDTNNGSLRIIFEDLQAMSIFPRIFEWCLADDIRTRSLGAALASGTILNFINQPNAFFHIRALNLTQIILTYPVLYYAAKYGAIHYRDAIQIKK